MRNRPILYISGPYSAGNGRLVADNILLARKYAVRAVKCGWFPFTYYQDTRGKRLNMNISGRIIHDRLKALLIDVEIGYLDFSQAMMAYRAIPGPDGRAVALQDAYEQCGDRLPTCGFDLRLALSDGERGGPTDR